jgi:hypothetical protein
VGLAPLELVSVRMGVAALLGELPGVDRQDDAVDVPGLVRFAVPLRPMVDAVITMDPQRCSIMIGAAALTVCHVPVRSMSMTACQFSLLSSHAFPVNPVIPAFALTMSSRPKRSSPIATAAAS